MEVKHGKDRHEIAVDDGSITTARDLMDRLLDITGVLQKNQKLLAKGKVLEADVPLASQMKPKSGRATVMLMASAGGGGGNAPKMTAGEAALAASRAAKAAKLADARKDGLEAMEVWDLGACPLNLHSCTSVAALTQILPTNKRTPHSRRRLHGARGGPPPQPHRDFTRPEARDAHRHHQDATQRERRDGSG